MDSKVRRSQDWTAPKIVLPTLPSDEAYRLLFECSSLPMLVYDNRTLQFLAVNDRAVHDYGYTRCEFLSLATKDIWSQEDIPHSFDPLAGYPEEGRAPRIWKHEKKDGTPIDAEITPQKVVFGGKPAVLVVVHNITRIPKTPKIARDISTQILQVQDGERRLIARGLHDTTLQSLTMLILQLGILSERLSSEHPDCRQAVLDCEHSAEQCVSELRTLSYLLNPPALKQLGLREAVAALVLGFSERSKIAIELEIPQDIGVPSRDTEMTLYSVVQEALLNVQRHSKTKQVFVRFSKDPQGIAVSVSDDGRGFCLAPVEAMGMGVIPGMRERLAHLGGKLEISSSQSGTSLKVVVPLG